MNDTIESIKPTTLWRTEWGMEPSGPGVNWLRERPLKSRYHVSVQEWLAFPVEVFDARVDILTVGDGLRVGKAFVENLMAENAHHQHLMEKIERASKLVFEKIQEWPDDLDESSCPTGFVTCSFCEGGGYLKGRRQGKELRGTKMIPSHKDGCVYAALKAILSHDEVEMTKKDFTEACLEDERLMRLSTSIENDYETLSDWGKSMSAAHQRVRETYDIYIAAKEKVDLRKSS